MSNHEFILDGETIDCVSEKKGDYFHVSVGDQKILVLPLGHNLYSAELNGQRRIVAAAKSRGVVYLDVDSVQLELREPGEDGFAGGAGDHGAEKDKVFAPMPGKIVKVLVNVGDEVKEKQPLVIVEAMKMENQVLARAAGKVKAVHFSDGDQVDTESPLIELDVKEPTA